MADGTSTPTLTAPPPPAPRARELAKRALAGESLFSRFAYLVASQALLWICGIAYWAITARLVPAHDVGIAAAGVSMAMVLAGIGVLGISSLVLVESTTLESVELRVFVTTGAAIAAAIVALLALIIWAVSPWLGPNLHELGRSPLDGVAFIVGAAALVGGTVLDGASIGLRKGRAQFGRNAIQSGLRLGLVIGAVLGGLRNATVLLLAWALSLVVSDLVVPRLLGLSREPCRSFRTRLSLVRRFATTALRHHALNVAITSVSYFLPAIAALIVDPKDYAYFSVAQLVASTVLLPPALLAMTLFAETTGDELKLHHSVRRTLPVGFACVALILAVFEPTAPLALRVFGPVYAAHGAATLRILLLGGIPYVVKDHYVAIRRAQRRLTEAAVVVALSTVLEVAGAATGGALFGLPGLCLGWVIGASLEGVVFAPPVISMVRGTKLLSP